MEQKESFSKKKKKLSEILNSNELGYQTTPEETAYITKFFRQYHPDWEEKTIGLKVITYIITKVRTHCILGRCFFLKLENGETNDIGFNGLSAHPKNPEQYARKNIAAACRHAIAKPCIRPLLTQVNQKFIKGLPVFSEYSNEKITSISEVNIDHYDMTFDELVSQWIELKGLDYLFSKVNMGDQQSTITEFTDKELIDEFVKFHNQHTHLRVVSKKENMFLSKKV